MGLTCQLANNHLNWHISLYFQMRYAFERSVLTAPQTVLALPVKANRPKHANVDPITVDPNVS
jgi:hypothetical protein